MAAMGIPVVIVPNGAPVSPGALGTPVTIVGGSGNVAVVNDGSSMSLKGTDGSVSFGNAVATVSNGAVTSVRLPAGSTIITDQAGALNVQDADGTIVNCTATITPGSSQLSYIGVPGTAALLTGGMSVKVANNGGGGPLDGNAQITGGFINWIALANATDCLISNGFTTNVSGYAVSGTTDFATVNVSSGALQSVGVSLAPTKAVATNGQELTIPVTGTYTTKATLTVSGGAITAITLS